MKTFEELSDCNSKAFLKIREHCIRAQKTKQFDNSGLIRTKGQEGTEGMTEKQHVGVQRGRVDTSGVIRVKGDNKDSLTETEGMTQAQITYLERGPDYVIKNKGKWVGKSVGIRRRWGRR